MDLLHQTLKAALIGISVAFVTSLPANAGVTTPAQVPLFVAGITKANVMLLLDDSGSMEAIAPGAPFDSDITYSCPAATTLNSASVGILYA